MKGVKGVKRQKGQRGKDKKNVEQGITNYEVAIGQNKKRKHRATFRYPMFSGGEKISYNFIIGISTDITLTEKSQFRLFL